MRPVANPLLSNTSLAAALLVCCCISPTLAQSPPWGRALSFGGAGSDWGSTVKLDRHRNKYLTGFFSGTAAFGGQSLTSAGGADIFLMKIGSDGQQQWVVRAGGSGDDEGFDIAFDGFENVYLAGNFIDSATFESVGGQIKTVTGNGSTIFLAKFDPSGKVIWIQTGTPQFFSANEGFGVAINPASGMVFLTGRAQGTTVFSSANGSSHSVPGPFAWHMYLVKYDSRGNFQWGEWNEASPNSVAHKVAVDSDNNAYVVGWFESVATFHSRDGNNQTLTGLSGPVQTAPDYPDDAFVAKYDSHGNLQWVNDIGGYKAIADDVAAGPGGQVSVTGFIGNINYGDTAQAQTIVTSQPPGTNINLGGGHFTNPYNRDVFIATYDATGVAKSATRIGGSLQDAGSGVAYDAQGNLYLAGVFQGTVDFNGTNVSSSLENNLFVAQYAGDQLAWVKVARGAGSQSYENDPRLAVNPATGKVFVTGPYVGNAFFGHTLLQSLGAEDIFLGTISASTTP